MKKKRNQQKPKADRMCHEERALSAGKSKMCTKMQSRGRRKAKGICRLSRVWDVTGWRSCNGNGCISAVVMCMIHWMSVATIAAGSDTLGFTFVRVSEIWVRSFVDWHSWIRRDRGFFWQVQGWRNCSVIVVDLIPGLEFDVCLGAVRWGDCIGNTITGFSRDSHELRDKS